MYTFANRKILVTGSSRGIGRAVAERLSATGATLGIHGRDASRVEAACGELAGRGSKAIPLVFDFSDPAQAVSAVRAFCDRAGGIDGLVNNAGGGKASAFRGMALEKWRSTFSVNLEAAMLAAREAYSAMRSGGGTIVNIASIAAHGPGKWMGADYAASKAGLVSITKSLAFEAARFGIRVNAVSPGLVDTDMTAILPEETRKGLNIPLGRFAAPAEVAAAVAFLLSDASAYITGEVLHVDGGLWM
ncbi:MAG: hypothetical protein C0404_12580 [Verrucomicrobia bacterium]|nr:hypothetical protein [Verrucomicrobiota bacterium]